MLSLVFVSHGLGSNTEMVGDRNSTCNQKKKLNNVGEFSESF